MAGFLFGGDTGETAQSLARKRDIQDMLARQIMGAQPKTAQEGIGALLSGIGVGISRYRTDKAQQAGTDAASKLYNSILGTPARSTTSAPSVTPGAMGGNMPKVDSKGNMPVATVGNDEIRNGIISSANALGIDPVDLATAISYETAGTFDPTKRGPTTQWGQHQGFLQFGEPQAKEHGVDWNNPVGSQLGENGAVVSYLRKAGVKPGMGMMDIYSAINAGSVGRYGASDANNGGAPGTVADKVNNQMAGHREKALALIGQGGATVGEPMAYYDEVETRQPAFYPDAQTRPAGDARSTVDAPAPRNAAEAVTAMAGGGMPATSPFVSPFVDPRLQAAAAANQAGASLSDEVAAYEQTPEYAARFPGRAVAPSFPGKQADDTALAALPQGVSVGANPVPPNSQPLANTQIPAEFAGSQQLASAEGGIMNALNAGTPATPQHIAHARTAGQQPVQVAQSAGGVDPRLYEILSNDFATPEMKAVARTMLQQQLGEQEAAREEETWRRRQEYERQAAQNDPLYRIKLQQAQTELEGGKKQPLINAGNGNVYDPNTKEWITPPGASGAAGEFRFSGNSVEAQALNGLMDSKQLTPDQAQQLGAGKTITGPNGEIIFLTPQGVFGTSAQGGGDVVPITPQGGQAAPQGGTQAAPQTTPQAMPQSVPQATPDQRSQAQPAPLPEGQPVRSGNIQITEPKTTVDEKQAMGFADRMVDAGGTIDKFGAYAPGLWDQFWNQNGYVWDPIENVMVSDDFQQLEQARRNFINAQLRRESGAVIGQDEFDNANRQYFPQFGDTKETIEQKKRNRQTATDAMVRSAGPTYKSPNVKDGENDPLGIRK